MGDSLPKLMPLRAIVVAAEDDEFWCVGLKCTCGCGYTIELPVIKEAKPRWDIQINSALLHKPICKGFFSDIIFK